MGMAIEAAILLYNEDHIVLRNLELTNEASHLDEFGVTKKLDGFGGETNSWGSGRDVRFGVKVVADGRSLDHFRMDSLFIHDIFPTPVNDNFVHQEYGIKLETRSNTPNATSTGACSLFDPGPNASWPRVVTVTTPDSVDSGASQTIGLHVTALPLSGADGRIVRTLADGSWYNGPALPLELGDNLIEVPEVGHERTVRMQVSSGDVGFDALTVNDGQLLCDGTELDGEVRLISDVLVEGCEFERTGHYAIWVKSLGLVGIDAYKNEGITVQGCGFLPYRGIWVCAQQEPKRAGRGLHIQPHRVESGRSDVEAGQRSLALRLPGCCDSGEPFPQRPWAGDSYRAHIDYGNENVVLQYNFSYHNEGGFVEILGDNIRCGYRYNISVNDGYREDPDGEPWDKKGKIFWVGNYCGSSTVRCPSTETFIYNNTVFVTDTLTPRSTSGPRWETYTAGTTSSWPRRKAL